MYGLTDGDWEWTQAEIRAITIRIAQMRTTISYGELADQLTMMTLSCALVVNKERGIPGDGYFRFAAEYGRDVSDIEAHWRAAAEQVYSVWAEAHG